MPVYLKDRKSVCFVHIPKTGGGSISKFLTDLGFQVLFQLNGLPPQTSLLTSPQHADMTALQQLVNIDSCDLVFSVVRSPYGRLLSEYRWVHRDMAIKPDLNVWLANALYQLKDDENIYDSHLKPMSKFLIPSENLKIFKYEHGLELVISFILNQFDENYFGTDLGRVHSLKTAMKADASISVDSFSADSLEMINAVYREDFSAFGYQMLVPSHGDQKHGAPFEKKYTYMNDSTGKAYNLFHLHYSTLSKCILQSKDSYVLRKNKECLAQEIKRLCDENQALEKSVEILTLKLKELQLHALKISNDSCSRTFELHSAQDEMEHYFHLSHDCMQILKQQELLQNRLIDLLCSTGI